MKENKLTSIAAFVVVLSGLLVATPIMAGPVYQEYWSGTGDPYTYLGFQQMGYINPFHEWNINIDVEAEGIPYNIAASWSDQYGHTGTIQGHISYLSDGAGYGVWDCDQHPTSFGTWTGSFGRGGVGSSCSGTFTYYYQGGYQTGGWFSGTRDQ